VNVVFDRIDQERGRIAFLQNAGGVTVQFIADLFDQERFAIFRAVDQMDEDFGK